MRGRWLRLKSGGRRATSTSHASSHGDWWFTVISKGMSQLLLMTYSPCCPCSACRCEWGGQRRREIRTCGRLPTSTPIVWFECYIAILPPLYRQYHTVSCTVLAYLSVIGIQHFHVLIALQLKLFISRKFCWKTHDAVNVSCEVQWSCEQTCWACCLHSWYL